MTIWTGYNNKRIGIFYRDLCFVIVSFSVEVYYIVWDYWTSYSWLPYFNPKDITSRDDSALSGIDYLGFAKRLVSFGTNSDTAVVEVDILTDRIEEGNEKFTVYILGADVQIGEGTMTVTIEDNDGMKVKYSPWNETTNFPSRYLCVTRSLDHVRPRVSSYTIRIYQIMSFISNTTSSFVVLYPMNANLTFYPYKHQIFPMRISHRITCPKCLLHYML